MRHAIIMAGGAGKRLWPLSRAGRPKQLLPLIAGRSLLEAAVDRLDGVFEPANIHVITNAEYAGAVAETLTELPAENIVGEPVGRDTANAVALGAALLAGKDQDATMAVFTADHVIRPVATFAESVRLACRAAEADGEALVTFGIPPTWAHTGLGYVHVGEESRDGVFAVRGFKEKPEAPAARKYVRSGQYYWNSGMFVWTLGAISGALAEFLPASVERLAGVTKAVQAGEDYTALLAEVYPGLEKISIDYAVMERARNVKMVPLSCEWLDVGSWPALKRVSEADEAGNTVLAANASILEGSGNIIVSEDDHLLAVLGMTDCVIVHSPDATLVCSESAAERLKDLVARVEDKYGRRYV